MRNTHLGHAETSGEGGNSRLNRLCHAKTGHDNGESSSSLGDSNHSQYSTNRTKGKRGDGSSNYHCRNCDAVLDIGELRG